MLIQGLPQHEFVIYSIGAEAKDRGAFKYKFPPNVKGVQEEFLDEILNQYSNNMQENILTAEEREAIYDKIFTKAQDEAVYAVICNPQTLYAYSADLTVPEFVLEGYYYINQFSWNS
jgi:hypothetical protein